jgi:hypothetical protein
VRSTGAPLHFEKQRERLLDQHREFGRISHLIRP